MSTEPRPCPANGLSRRELLSAAGRSAAGLSLLTLLGQGGLFLPRAAAAAVAAGSDDPLAARLPHFAPKAKHCIFLFMFGGPSQMDLFDYKPELSRRDGQSVDMEMRRNDVKSSVLLGSKRSFKQHGQTGQWCSDALPALSAHMDRLAVIKSLYTDSFAHGSAVLQMNSGQALQGHPAMGSWITHGLGSSQRDLPPFVVMHDPRGGPISGPANWSAGYMPAAYQGTLFRSTGDPLLFLSPEGGESGRSGLSREMQKRQIDTLVALNAAHTAAHPGTSELAARSASYELAYRMQESAPEALDLSTEPEDVRRLYALDAPRGPHRLAVAPGVFGRQCLIARRLVQRGVRFVQIYHGGGHQQQTWDAHHGVEENLSIHCPEVDQPIAGLLTDLARTGLLDETLVIWGGEFGRQPVGQLAIAGQQQNPDGRDHNPKGFSMWMAGAGIRPGSVGETDELGSEAAVERHHIRNLHATVLHLMGLDWHRLTFPYGGLDRKLTGVIEPQLIQKVLA
ncbi:MAG: DUF1501 domain-containing protein [Planctomycetota bacterium]